ncbi:MAG: hypothetical protein GJ676_21715 [Rhodobacteraceae bacterium]|nr:hypothetical protein [Paracoccaceae bacterium]
MAALVYLLYGNKPSYQNELSYSVLTAVSHAQKSGGAVDILLFCDEASARHDLPVENIVLSPEKLEDWSLGGSYFHLIKIHVVREALRRFRIPICFVDTDTEFLAAPSLLFERMGETSSLMHSKDGVLAEMPLWSGLLDHSADPVVGGALSPDAAMLNSGLIGVHPTQAMALDQALELARALYSIAPVFNIEQFALGACLQAQGPVHFGADVVAHYWGYERFNYHEKIPGVLAGLPKDLRQVDVSSFSGIEPAEKPLSAKLRARFWASAKGWSDDQRFAYLAYLCSQRARTSSDRRVWSQVHAEALSGLSDGGASLGLPDP